MRLAVVAALFALLVALVPTLVGTGELPWWLPVTALAVLVHVHREVAASGARLIVADPSPVVVRILHLAGLFALLDVDGAAE